MELPLAAWDSAAMPWQFLLFRHWLKLIVLLVEHNVVSLSLFHATFGTEFKSLAIEKGFYFPFLNQIIRHSGSPDSTS